jgi:putative ABC transport system permease protein
MTWPFENNTNAITRKLAKRSLQADKRRNIFLIVTITLTTALLSGIFFTVFAEQRKMLSDLRGQYQTVVMETTQKEIEHLSTQPEIEQWGLSKDFGSARYQDSTLVVEYADKGWMKLGKKPSYIGNFPEKEQEIIVEQAFLDYFGLPQETGQTIRLNLGNGDRDYVISGILQKENNSRLFSVIVSKAFLEAQAKGELLYEFRFRFVGADRTDTDDLKADIAAFLADNNIPENRIFYSSNYFDIRSFQSDGVMLIFPLHSSF